MAIFPLPGMGRAVVAVPAPGQGPGWWAGASSAAADPDGGFVVGYRVRNGHDGIDQTVVARSPDGERFTTVATLDQSRFGAQWMERPAVVRTPEGRWRLFVCCGTPESKHWWIEVLEADDPAALATAEARPAFPGDDRTAVKDPIVRRIDGRWHAWICCHPLETPGAEDRMSTAYAPIPNSPIIDVRSLDVLPLPTGAHRIYYEARLPDESHELRTELISAEST